MTTSDVAREAGVSRATVSYVLNDRRDVRVSEETRERVWEVARRLGYSGSPAARALRTGRGDVVLILTPPWAMAGPLGALMEKVGEHVFDDGLMCVRYEGSRWIGQLDQLLARIPAACVVTLAPLGDHDAHALQAAGIPEVTAWALDHPTQAATMSIRQADLVAAQVDHLLERGYPRLGYVMIADPEHDDFARARLAAFGEACRRRGVPEAHQAVLPEGADTVGPIIAEWLAESPAPLGIATWDDVTGLAVLTAAAAAGIEVPTGLGVIGCDDTSFAAHAHPPLSSVRFDLDAEATGIASRIAAAAGRPARPRTGTAAVVSAVPRRSTALRSPRRG